MRLLNHSNTVKRVGNKNFGNIFDAARKGTLKEVMRFVERKSPDVNEKDADGWTPLFFAAESNPNADVLRYLVSQGGAVAVKTNSGRTLLHSAAQGTAAIAVLRFLVSSQGSNQRKR